MTEYTHENAAAIWDRIGSIVSRVPGWSPAEELFSLYHLALLAPGNNPAMLEVGSWCGRSTAALALAMEQRAGSVDAVDLFPERDDWRRNADGSYSFEVRIGTRHYGAYNEQRVWAEPYERDIVPVYARFAGILEAFTTHLADEGLSHRVSAFRGDLTDFLASGSSRAAYQLVFLDGDHGYEAVCNDIRYSESVLAPGGWLAFDDAFTVYDGVDKAIRDLVIASGRYESGTQLTRKMFAARRR